MNINVDISGDSGARAALADLRGRAAPALVTAINRVERDLKSRILTRTTGVYNISRRDLAPFVTVQPASRNNVNGTVRLLIRAIPIEAFRPTVRMQEFTFTVRGKTVTRKLPAIYLRRLRNGPEHYVPPAFPLTQRRGGVLARGERVRRRIDERRDRLTKIRYYTFPEQFVKDDLLPDAQEFIGPAIAVQLRSAFRRADSRGVDRLRRNA